MEFWGSCLLRLRTELDPVEKMLSQSNGVSTPKGTSRESENPFREFWESVEFLRAIFGSTFSGKTSFDVTFIQVLSVEEQLSFPETKNNLMWVGSDAALETCAAIDFSNKFYTIFSTQSDLHFLE